MQAQHDEQQAVLQLRKLGLRLQPLSDDGDEVGVQEGDVALEDLNPLFAGFHAA